MVVVNLVVVAAIAVSSDLFGESRLWSPNLSSRFVVVAKIVWWPQGGLTLFSNVTSKSIFKVYLFENSFPNPKPITLLKTLPYQPRVFIVCKVMYPRISLSKWAFPA
jgi:hypothetical protein